MKTELTDVSPTRKEIRIGIEPAVVLGHSLGEYVAACLAGVLLAPQGLGLVNRQWRCAAGHHLVPAVQHHGFDAGCTQIDAEEHASAHRRPLGLAAGGLHHLFH